MLDYQWTGGVHPASVMDDPDCPDDPSAPHSHSMPMVVDHYGNAAAPPLHVPVPDHAAAFFPHHFQQHPAPPPPQPQGNILLPFYDPRSGSISSYGGAASSSYYHHSVPAAAFYPVDSFPHDPTGGMVLPKSEDEVVVRPAAADFTAWIGLNLGGRTYFSSAEDDFVSRLYRRSRPLEAARGAAKAPRCQAEGCNADLSHAKHYHRRHKVCEFHSKAAAVISSGLTQRFCQQCSRFHLLSEFDNGKRSCRKRLADHNRRRRKSQQQPNLEILKPPTHGDRTNIIGSLSRSPQDSGNQTSSSVTVAVSPPRMSLDYCFRQRSTYNQHSQASSSSASSCSLFFSSG